MALIGQMINCLENPNIILSTRFKVRYTELLRQAHSFFSRDNPFVPEVHLVSDQHPKDILAGILYQLLDPYFFNVEEGLPVGDVVDEDGAVCLPEDRLGEHTILFLSRGIP